MDSIIYLKELVWKKNKNVRTYEWEQGSVIERLKFGDMEFIISKYLNSRTEKKTFKFVLQAEIHLQIKSKSGWKTICKRTCLNKDKYAIEGIIIYLKEIAKQKLLKELRKKLSEYIQFNDDFVLVTKD